jgi:hypothetical protein
MVTTSLFWNTSHKRQFERNGDPLGLDALREAMSDSLVPHLTGATIHADDYLWVLVGLRWARNDEGAKVDVDVWEAFRRFERGLKQYWQKFTQRRDYLGKREVVKLCEHDRPNVDQRILEDERATGLVGNYIASLRALNLVEKSALAPTTTGESLIRRIAFTRRAHTFTSWSGLDFAFAETEQQVRRCRGAFGRRLFEDARMRRAAVAVLAKKDAHSWGTLADHLVDEQRRVARACGTILDVEVAMVEAFCDLLGGAKTLRAEERTRLRTRTARARGAKPIPEAWERQPIAKAIDASWRGCSDGRQLEQCLLELHVEVVRTARGNEPWIAELGEQSLVEFRPNFNGRDFRLRNLQRLVSETKWRPNAA